MSIACADVLTRLRKYYDHLVSRLFINLSITATPRDLLMVGDDRGSRAEISADQGISLLFRRRIKALLVAMAGVASLVNAQILVAAPAVADAPSTAAAAEYALGPGDKVKITIFGEPELSGEFTVSEIGNLSLPLIGEVQSNGLTIPQLQRTVTARFAKGYLSNPQVNAQVAYYRPFYILGEVNKPGEYPFSSGLTVLNAVAKAAGFTYRANQRRVFITRAGSGQEVKVPLSAATLVQPGDTIRIGERFF